MNDCETEDGRSAYDQIRSRTVFKRIDRQEKRRVRRMVRKQRRYIDNLLCSTLNQIWLYNRAGETSAKERELYREIALLKQLYFENSEYLKHYRTGL